MAKEKQGAMYMFNEKLNLVKLVAGEDIEDFSADGYEVLSGKRGDNGEDWNRPKDQAGRDAAAAAAKFTAELDAKEAEEENKAIEDARKASEKAAEKAEADAAKKK